MHPLNDKFAEQKHAFRLARTRKVLIWTMGILLYTVLFCGIFRAKRYAQYGFCASFQLQDEVRSTMKQFADHLQAIKDTETEFDSNVLRTVGGVLSGKGPDTFEDPMCSYFSSDYVFGEERLWRGKRKLFCYRINYVTRVSSENHLEDYFVMAKLYKPSMSLFVIPHLSSWDAPRGLDLFLTIFQRGATLSDLHPWNNQK